MRGDDDRGARCPAAEEVSLAKLLAMSISPFALPRPNRVHAGLPPAQRRAARAANQRFIQAHLGRYIDRSGYLVLGAFVGMQFSIYLFASPALTVVAGALLLLSLLHTVVVIFWKQHLDNRFGPVPPPE